MADNFYPINGGILGALNWLWRGNKDRFTQTPIMSSGQIIGAGRQEQWITISGKENEIYQTTPHLQIVINKLAGMYCNGVFKHYQIKSDGSYVEIPNSPYVELFENPNVLQQTSAEFMRLDFIYQSIFGNSMQFALKGYDSQQVPSAIWLMMPQFMKLIQTGKIHYQVKIEDIIEKYVYCLGGKDEDFLPKDIIHFRSPNPENPLVGLSPLLALQMPITNLRAALGRRNILLNGAKGIISSGGKNDGAAIVPMTPEQKKTLEQQFDNNYGIRSDQSSMIISQAPNLSFQAIDYKTKDLALFEEVNDDFRAIMDHYGAKKELFSEEKGSTFSNAEEAKKMVYQDTIIPFADGRADAYTKKFGLVAKKQFIAIDYSRIECLQSNQKEQAETLAKRVESYVKLHDSGFNEDRAQDLTGIK